MIDDKILQERFTSFTKELSIELNEPIYGSILVIQLKDSIGSAIVIGGSINIQKQILRSISTSFVKIIENLRAKMNTRSEDDQDELK